MGDVIQFSGITKLDIDPDTILENLKGELKGFVLSGWDKDGNEFFASSLSDSRDIGWLLDRFKFVLMADSAEEYPYDP